MKMIGNIARGGLVCLALALPLQAETRIQDVTSPNGVEAWLVEEHSIPMVALEIVFDGGASLDPEGKEGVANLMAGMLEEGAGDLDAEGFALRSESLGARMGFRAGDDGVSVSARFLSESLDASGDLLSQALTRPRFDATALARVKSQVISGIRSDSTDPSAIAGRAWDKMAWGDDPYGRPLDGTEASVTALTADDLEAARQRLLVRSRVTVAAVGDIDAERLGRLIDRILDDLPTDGPPLPGPAEFQTGAETRVIEFDTPQSVALFGHEGILRSDPDFIPAYVMNYILGGGGFVSRLTDEVREKRGLTYSVYSYLDPAERGAAYRGGVSSDNARIAEALDVIRTEWRRMAEGGVTEEELRDAKKYLTGAYPLRFDSNASIARILAGVKREGLGIDYIAKRNSLVEAVTRDDIARVAARILKPDQLKVVVVGKPVGLTP